MWREIRCCAGCVQTAWVAVCGELPFSFLFLHYCHAPLSVRCPGTVVKSTFMGLPLYWRKLVITVICHTVMSIGERIRPRGMQGG